MNYADWFAINALIDNTLTKLAQYQAAWNVPVLAGEYWFWQHSSLYEKWMSGLNALDVSWTNWTYKVKNTESADEIAAKWAQFTTANFQPNTALQTLVAAATTPGVWSSLRAVATNGYVSAELAGALPLVANRTTVDIWEQFLVVTNADGTVSLLSRANRKYVSADLGRGALQALANDKFVGVDLTRAVPVLVADRTNAGEGEAFVIAPLAP